MNLEQLETIRAIIETGSFRAASEKLHKSQPALSASVKNLEDEFGIQIFDRSEYRPKLTEKGAIFVNAAVHTLESAQRTARIGQELGQNKTELKLVVAIDPLVQNEVIAKMAFECARPQRPVSLILERTLFQNFQPRLLSGELDLAVATNPEDISKVEIIELNEVELVGAISRKLLQEKREPTKEILERHPQIFVYDKNKEEPMSLLTPKNTQENQGPKIFVSEHQTKVQLIEAGLGWGLICDEELKSNKDLIKIKSTLSKPKTLKICLMKAKSKPQGPIARAIWHTFEKEK